MKIEIYTIDATGRSLGRIASEAAAKLRGKNLVTFERHLVPSNKVRIVNASQAKISPRQRTDKLYQRYSGYPGGLRFEALGPKLARRGATEIFRLAIKRMLPVNKLHARLLKNLSVED